MHAQDCCPHSHRQKLNLRAPVTAAKVPPLLSPNAVFLPPPSQLLHATPSSAGNADWRGGAPGPAPSGHWLRWRSHRPSRTAQHVEECYDMTFCPGIVSSPGARLSQSLCGQGDSSAPLAGGMGHTCEAFALQPVTPPLHAGCLYCPCLTRELQRPKETNYQDTQGPRKL